MDKTEGVSKTKEQLIAEAEQTELIPSEGRTSVLINLLPPREDTTPAPAVVPVGKVRSTSWQRWLAWGLAGAVAFAGGIGAGWIQRNVHYPLAQAKPTPTASAAPTPTPTPTALPSTSPSATPSPSPSATPTPQTVTAPAVAPTADHPQTVTITAKNGMWLRSSPTSENQSNVIGWMPSGAQISVDSADGFWWHGTYKGKSGYFASAYTE